MTEANEEYKAILRNLTDIQLRFLSARLGCHSDREAARRAGINEQTPSRWENIEDIRRAIQLARLDGVELATEKLRRLATDAVDVYEDEMQGRRNNPQRLAAANQVMKLLGMEPPEKKQLTGPEGGPILIDIITELVTGDNASQ